MRLCEALPDHLPPQLCRLKVRSFAWLVLTVCLPSYHVHNVPLLPHLTDRETEAWVVESDSIPVPGPSWSLLPLTIWDPEAVSGPPLAALPGVSSAGLLCPVGPVLACDPCWEADVEIVPR